MAHRKFPVEVLTPTGEVFNEEVEMLSAFTTVGSIGILANHSPVLAVLEPSELRLYRSQSEIVRFAQSEGYMQVGDNRALVLVQEALAPESLDAEDLGSRLADARGAVDRAPAGSEQQAQARREVRRLEAFLAIAQGTPPGR